VKCCSPPSGYSEFFSNAQAERDARRYRRKGLDKAAQWVVDAVRERGVNGRSVLEPGGGVGGIEIELLKAGASRSLIVELSPGYDDAARELASEEGVEDRLERRLGDFADADIAEADVVVLHRVVCCYPDYERLLGAAAEKARHTLVFTYPPRNLVARMLFATLNLWMRVRGKEFRAFAHRPERMADVVRRAGFEPFTRRRGGIWRGTAFERR
jgi:magnesium-protoporphyrin O-methyltransferase